jgi:hypothetical protein
MQYHQRRKISYIILDLADDISGFPPFSFYLEDSSFFTYAIYIFGFVTKD